MSGRPRPAWQRLIETHKWPHTRTVHLSSDGIKALRTWLSENCGHCGWYVDVNRRKFTDTTGLYSVVIRVQDDSEELWMLIRLTWC